MRCIVIYWRMHCNLLVHFSINRHLHCFASSHFVTKSCSWSYIVPIQHTTEKNIAKDEKGSKNIHFRFMSNQKEWNKSHSSFNCHHYVHYNACTSGDTAAQSEWGPGLVFEFSQLLDRAGWVGCTKRGQAIQICVTETKIFSFNEIKQLQIINKHIFWRPSCLWLISSWLLPQ